MTDLPLRERWPVNGHRAWSDLEQFLLDTHIKTGDARFQDAATLLYQQDAALDAAEQRGAARCPHDCTEKILGGYERDLPSPPQAASSPQEGS